jgi:hypothetical protein
MARSEAIFLRTRSTTLGLALLAVVAGLGTPERAWSAGEVKPIRFAHGASSAEVRGAVIRGERMLYSVEARGGQNMSLRITAVEGNAVFQVYAPGAKPRMRDDGVLEIAGEALAGAGEGDDATRWTGLLARSGAYLLVVGATRGNASYRLIIDIR